MKTIGYLRISTGKQDLDIQKLELLNYANKQGFHIDSFVMAEVSSRKTIKQRKLDLLFDQLNEGDTLLVSELSRLGRSVGQVVTLVYQLIKKQILFIAIKENILIDRKQTLQSKVMVSLFGLFAEIERDLISERTKQGLIAAKAKGRILGRPLGSLGTSKLDSREDEIKNLLYKRVSISSMARILNVSRTCLSNFISTRKL